MYFVEKFLEEKYLERKLLIFANSKKHVMELALFFFLSFSLSLSLQPLGFNYNSFPVR